jgi:hypothetical protein
VKSAAEVLGIQAQQLRSQVDEFLGTYGPRDLLLDADGMIGMQLAWRTSN